MEKELPIPANIIINVNISSQFRGTGERFHLILRALAITLALQTIFAVSIILKGMRTNNLLK